MKRIVIVLATFQLMISFLCANGIKNSRSYATKEAVIIDSLIAVDQLSGSIYYQQNYATVDANWMEGETWIGDYYDMGWMAHFASIGYLSFEVPIISDDYTLQAARLMMYIGAMRGNSASGVYPIFNYGNTAVHPEGVLEHIDYGDAFNSNDVIPSSVYASYTLFDYESLMPPCWVIYDVTECLLMDIDADRTLSQYRLYLSGFSDWDNRDDFIATNTSSSQVFTYSPKIVYILSDGTSNNDLVNDIPQISLSSFPNPFTELCSILYKTTELCLSKLTIYNTKGQLIRTYGKNVGNSGDQTYSWDGKDSNGKQVSGGIYLAVAQTGNKTAKTKILYLK